MRVLASLKLSARRCATSKSETMSRSSPRWRATCASSAVSVNPTTAFKTRTLQHLAMVRLQQKHYRTVAYKQMVLSAAGTPPLLPTRFFSRLASAGKRRGASSLLPSLSRSPAVPASSPTSRSASSVVVPLAFWSWQSPRPTVPKRSSASTCTSTASTLPRSMLRPTSRSRPSPVPVSSGPWTMRRRSAAQSGVPLWVWIS